MKEKDVKKTVKKHYSKIAEKESSCCSCTCDSNSDEKIAKAIGYSEEEISNFSEANMGLGCGNPIALSNIKEGDIVLDLGSGAGFDCFLAARRVGNTGKIIGVDMTKEMIKKSESLAEKYGFKNIEFRLGDIENLPIEDKSIDVIISNCVINLAPDKLKVFKDSYRVLKDTGKMYISDIVLLEELTEKQRNDEKLVAGCVGGALLKDEYLQIIKNAGFKYRILNEDKDISKTQYQGVNLESLKVELYK